MAVKIGAVPVWPELPDELRDLLTDIAAEAEDQAPHVRPWELGSLPEPLREPTWAWLDSAVSWINHCYGWKAETVIPACWQQHPHLALDFAVLAFAREFAARSTLTRELRYWHDDLQGFYLRMREAIGETGLKDCQRGKHGERPSSYELEAYQAQR